MFWLVAEAPHHPDSTLLSIHPAPPKLSGAPWVAQKWAKTCFYQSFYQMLLGLLFLTVFPEPQWKDLFPSEGWKAVTGFMFPAQRCLGKLKELQNFKAEKGL